MTVSPNSDREVLALTDVGHQRGGDIILDGINLQVNRGEHWAVLGPNGAGKSTLLGFCGATSFPTTGTVDVWGHRLGRVELQALRVVDELVIARPALTSVLVTHHLEE